MIIVNNMLLFNSKVFVGNKWNKRHESKCNPFNACIREMLPNCSVEEILFVRYLWMRYQFNKLPL